MTYKPVTEGEWLAPIMRGYRIKCCDCHLVHAIDFKVTHRGRGHDVWIRIRRLNRATAAARRGRK